MKTDAARGLFQLESPMGVKIVNELASHIPPGEDRNAILIVAAAVALNRPGPMQADVHLDFIERGKDPSKIKYALPELEPILKKTRGLMIYQEQVIAIAKEIAGFDSGEGDIMRRAMGKKKQSEMDEQKAKFIEGGTSNIYKINDSTLNYVQDKGDSFRVIEYKINEDGIKVKGEEKTLQKDSFTPKGELIKKAFSEEEMSDLFSYIEKFAAYGFNKSHSVAYAFYAVFQALQKMMFSPEFYISQLKTTKDPSKRQILAITLAPYLKSQGYDAKKVDIRHIYDDYTVIENENEKSIYPPLELIGINAKDAEIINLIPAEKRSLGYLVGAMLLTLEDSEGNITYKVCSYEDKDEIRETLKELIKKELKVKSAKLAVTKGNLKKLIFGDAFSENWGNLKGIKSSMLKTPQFWDALQLWKGDKINTFKQLITVNAKPAKRGTNKNLFTKDKIEPLISEISNISTMEESFDMKSRPLAIEAPINLYEGTDKYYKTQKEYTEYYGEVQIYTRGNSLSFNVVPILEGTEEGIAIDPASKLADIADDEVDESETTKSSINGTLFYNEKTKDKEKEEILNSILRLSGMEVNDKNINELKINISKGGGASILDSSIKSIRIPIRLYKNKAANGNVYINVDLPETLKIIERENKKYEKAYNKNTGAQKI